MAKINLKQILAAIALAFALGVVAIPSDTFAAEGNTGSQVTAGATYTASAEDVVAMIKAVRGADTGNKYAALRTAFAAAEANPDGSFADLVAKITAFSTEDHKIEPNADDYDTVAEWKAYAVQNISQFNAWMGALDTIDTIYKETEAASDANDATLAAAINAKPAASRQTWYNALANFYYDTIGTIASNIVALSKRIHSTAELPDYPKMAALVAGVEAFNKEDITGTELDNAKTALTAALRAVLPADTTIATEQEAMIAQAKGVADYSKYADLYNACGFIRTITSNNPANLTVALVNSNVNATAQGRNYSAMRSAAVAIKPNIAHNLKGASELPNTGPDDEDDKPGDNGNETPTTPDAGIIGLIESGAIDMSTVILIASIAVASVAGLGLIAKLYLKHKF